MAIPPGLLPLLERHLSGTGVAPDALLFPAADGTSYLASSTFARPFYRARDSIGRPDLRFHDLRDTGAMLAALSGAMLPDLMNRLGHSTVGAAMRYQHAAQERDRELAMKMSENFTTH